MSGGPQINTLINPISILIGKNKLTSIITLISGILFGIIGLVFSKDYITILSAGLISFSHYMINILLTGYFSLPKETTSQTIMARKHARKLVIIPIVMITLIITSVVMIDYLYTTSVKDTIFYTVLFVGLIQIMKNYRSALKWVVLLLSLTIIFITNNLVLISIITISSLIIMLFDSIESDSGIRLNLSKLGVFNYIDDNILDIGFIKLIYNTIVWSAIILVMTTTSALIIYYGKVESLLTIVNNDVGSLVITYTKLPKNSLNITSLPVWVYFMITISLLYSGKNTLEFLTSKIFYKQLIVDSTNSIKLPDKNSIKNIIEKWQGKPVKIIIHQYDPQNPLLIITNTESINEHLPDNWWKVISIHSYHYINNMPDTLIVIDKNLTTTFIRLKMT